MSWNYLELQRYRPFNKHGKRALEQERSEMRERGFTLVKHSFKSGCVDEYGDFTFDQIIIRNFDTNEFIAMFEDDEMDQANHHYMNGNYWHADCYME